MSFKTPVRYLVVDEELHRVVPPLDQHDLVGLAGHRVREGRAHPGRRVGLDPQAHGERVHLRQSTAPLGFGVHVVGPEGEGQLELIHRSVFFSCGRSEKKNGFSHTVVHCAGSIGLICSAF